MILNKEKIKNAIDTRIRGDVACGRVGGAAAIVKQDGEVVSRASSAATVKTTI